MPDASAHPLRDRYESILAERGWRADPAQREALQALEALHDALQARWLADQRRRWWQRRRPKPPRGLYLWGGVGRGKTFLMDLFHESLAPMPALRSHFHRFMYDVHARLAALENEADPLQIVARDIADRCEVLCFDEFFVSDIADAMILGRLLMQLTAAGVTLVATSNSPPEQLYRDGLQRARFLPAIRHIERVCAVQNVDGGTDYRIQVLERTPCYIDADAVDAETRLRAKFEALSGGRPVSPDTLQIAGRPLSARAKAPGLAWFDFETLCVGPRSQNDYIELARRLHTIIVSGVPQMDGSDDNAARRFIALIDELYDRRVNLILSADVPLGELYTGARLAFEFQRTESRLAEMQTHEYLSSAHRP